MLTQLPEKLDLAVRYYTLFLQSDALAKLLRDDSANQIRGRVRPVLAILYIVCKYLAPTTSATLMCSHRRQQESVIKMQTILNALKRTHAIFRHLFDAC